MHRILADHPPEVRKSRASTVEGTDHGSADIYADTDIPDYASAKGATPDQARCVQAVPARANRTARAHWMPALVLVREPHERLGAS